MNNIKEKVDALPLLPGCYIFKNKWGHIIYIGKSKKLKSRVRQYFRPDPNKHPKLIQLAEEIYDLEYIITATETEALLLECKLIKENKPRYNSQLMESHNSYTMIQIVTDTEYPAIFTSNEFLSDDWQQDKSSRYFGAFHKQRQAEEVIMLLNEVWQTPACNRKSFNTSTNACLEYHLDKCMAPCEKRVATEVYNAAIASVVGFLEGKTSRVLSKLRRQMREAAENMDFENAAKYRDQQEKLQRLAKMSKHFSPNLKGVETYVFFRAYHEKCFSLFYIRDSKTLHRADFPLVDELDQNIVKGFLTQIKQGDFNVSVEEQDWRTVAITAVYASKAFIQIKKATSISRLIAKLNKGFSEFVG